MERAIFIRKDLNLPCFTFAFGLMLLFALALLAGCSTSESIGGGLPTPQEASGAATTNVSGKTANALGAVGRSTSSANTAVTNSFLRMIGEAPVTGDDPTGPIEAQINNSFGLLFQGNPTVDGSKITFNPDENQLCGDALFLTLFDDAKVSHDFTTSVTCPVFYSFLTLDLTVNSLTEGTLDFQYGGTTLTSLSYDDDPEDKFLINRINLANYKAISAFMNTQGFFSVDPDVPDTFEGIVGVETKDLGGGDHAQVRFFIEQDINIFDAAFGDDILIPASANLLDIRANGNTGDFSFGTDIGAGKFGTLTDNFDDTAEYPIRINWNAWSGFYQLDATDKNVINGSTTPISITQDIDDSEKLGLSPGIDWDLQLGNYQWALDGSTDTVRFDAAYDATFAIKDPLKVFNSTVHDGSLTVSKPFATELQYVSAPNAFGERVWEVKAGFVDISGTGTYGLLANPFTSGGAFTPGGRVSPTDVDNQVPAEPVNTVTFDGTFYPFQRTFKF